MSKFIVQETWDLSLRPNWLTPTPYFDIFSTEQEARNYKARLLSQGWSYSPDPNAVVSAFIQEVPDWIQMDSTISKTLKPNPTDISTWSHRFRHKVWHGVSEELDMFREYDWHNLETIGKLKENIKQAHINESTVFNCVLAALQRQKEGIASAGKDTTQITSEITSLEEAKQSHLDTVIPTHDDLVLGHIPPSRTNELDKKLVASLPDERVTARPNPEFLHRIVTGIVRAVQIRTVEDRAPVENPKTAEEIEALWTCIYAEIDSGNYARRMGDLTNINDASAMGTEIVTAANTKRNTPVDTSQPYPVPPDDGTPGDAGDDDTT